MCHRGQCGPVDWQIWTETPGILQANGSKYARQLPVLSSFLVIHIGDWWYAYEIMSTNLTWFTIGHTVLVRKKQIKLK